MKRFLNPATKIFFTLIVVFLIFPKKLYAYLDPGTGSYLLQLLIAFLIGGLLMTKLWWKKITTFFTGLFSPKQQDKKPKE